MDTGVAKLVGDVFHRYDVGLPVIGIMPWGSRFKMPPTLPQDSAPFAPLASLEAESRPPQPQAAAQQLGRQRSLLEGVSRGVSKRGLAILNQQAGRAA